MSEQISALMDDQLDGAEGEGCLRRLKDDESLRGDWEIYHLIGDTLRGTPARGMPAGFAGRLAAEPTVLAPRAVQRKPSQRRQTWYALSAAASVAAVAAVGWMALPMIQSSPPPTAMVQPPAVVQVPVSAPTVAIVPVAQGVGDYVLAHQRYSPRSAMAGVMPYVGSVADEAGKR
jgi:sigma-E factor negative regulatory protein RseA